MASGVPKRKILGAQNEATRQKKAVRRRKTAEYKRANMQLAPAQMLRNITRKMEKLKKACGDKNFGSWFNGIERDLAEFEEGGRKDLSYLRSANDLISALEEAMRIAKRKVERI